MKNDDRLLEMANDVDKMVEMLRDMKVWLNRSFDLASKVLKKAHQQDGNVIYPRQPNGEQDSERLVKKSSKEKNWQRSERIVTSSK